MKLIYIFPQDAGLCKHLKNLMEELGLPLCQHEPNPIPCKKNPVSF